MKPKKLKKKLTITKKTIANLNQEELSNAHGGGRDLLHTYERFCSKGDTCYSRCVQVTCTYH